MAAKAILVICAQVFLVQTVFSQCLSRGAIGACGGLSGSLGFAGTGLAYDGLGFGAYGAGCGLAAPASSGGGFGVASSSPIAPVGVSVVSDNVYEGPLAVAGQLPFLGTVALEGVLPTAGAGAVNYGCGNGAVGIASEGPITTGIVADGLGYGAGLGLGYGAGLGLGYGAGLGLGYNGLGLGLEGIGYGRGGCGCGIY